MAYQLAPLRPCPLAGLLLVDEAQDLTPSQIELLSIAATSSSSLHTLLVGDPLQVGAWSH
jgi:hypothetical protein